MEMDVNHYRRPDLEAKRAAYKAKSDALFRLGAEHEAAKAAAKGNRLQFYIDRIYKRWGYDGQDKSRDDI